MKVTVDHTELMTILENNGTINEAILNVAQVAATGDLVSMLDAVIRSHQLILQALKSNTAIINQIRERHE
jgi:hypothetical protein